MTLNLLSVSNECPYCSNIRVRDRQQLQLHQRTKRGKEERAARVSGNATLSTSLESRCFGFDVCHAVRRAIYLEGVEPHNNPGVSRAQVAMCQARKHKRIVSVL